MKKQFVCNGGVFLVVSAYSVMHFLAKVHSCVKTSVIRIGLERSTTQKLFLAVLNYNELEEHL
jgi:hypothetical protein